MKLMNNKNKLNKLTNILTMIRILLLTTIYTIFETVNADIFVLILPTDKEVVRYTDREANFGPRISTQGLAGVMIYSSPAHGCSSIQRPPNSNHIFWIAVISKGGNCTYEKKIRNAQSAGYICAIVHNNDGERLEIMSAINRTGIRIPSVFVGESTGKELRDRFQYDVNSTTFNYYVIVSSSNSIKINAVFAMFTVTGMFLILVICIYLDRFIRVRRRERRLRMPQSSLKKLPTKSYSEVDSYDTCVICMQDFIKDETIRVLPCNHAYHMICVDKWLTKHRRQCPTCRRKIYAYDETPHSDSDSDSNYIEESYNERSPLISSTNNVYNSGTFQTTGNNRFNQFSRLFPRQYNQIQMSSSSTSSSSNIEPISSTIFDDDYLNNFLVHCNEPQENSNNTNCDHNSENESLLSSN